MEILNQIKKLSQKVSSTKNNIGTEEATKNAFIMPFIHLLGYDVFNPNEVVPEFTADIGTKKGEKVDYAIMNNGEPVILIEAKHWVENLDNHNSQLYRYFNATKCKFGLLTNGIQFRFFTDLNEPNKMDTQPFLEVDLNNIKDTSIQELAKFHKSAFNAKDIYDNAGELKYVKSVRDYLSTELEEISPEFSKYVAKKVYGGKVVTGKVVEQFQSIVKSCFNEIIKDMVNERLKAALSKEDDQEEEIKPVSNIVTTDEEIESYHVVRAIGSKIVPPARIVHRDTQSYFGILLDDNNRKPICRVFLNGKKKFIQIGNNNTPKYEINGVEDIYKYEEQIVNSINNY